MHVKDPHIPKAVKQDTETSDWLARYLDSWHREEWAKAEAVRTTHASFYLTPFITKYRAYKNDR